MLARVRLNSMNHGVSQLRAAQCTLLLLQAQSLLPCAKIVGISSARTTKLVVAEGIVF